MEQQIIANGGLQYVAQSAQQYVFLDFDGELTSYNGEILTVDNVEVQDSSLTEERIANIIAELNEKYVSQNVIFVTERPETAEYSTIYIGKTSAFDAYGSFAGLAENIDEGNLNKSDNAFVMLDSTASDEQLIATISHETDHLLGTLDHGGEGLAAYAARTIIGNGVTSTGLTINSGNYMDISNGGVANNTTVEYFGSMYVSSGGVANNTTVGSKGVLNVHRGGVANNTTVNSSGGMHIYITGVASNTTVNSGGSIDVRMGATATDISVAAGGRLYITIAPDTYIQGTSAGSAFEVKDAQITGYTINNGVMNIGWGGIANSTTVNSSGVIFLESDGVANSTTLNCGGTMYFASSGGGTANYTLVNSGGCMTVNANNVANNTVVNSGGKIIIYSRGKVNTVTVNSGGTMYISSGATGVGIVENGGYVVVKEARVTFASNTINGVNLSGAMTVHGNTIANSTTVNSGGQITIFSRGVANSTTVNDGGWMNIESGGVANSTTVNSRGSITISSGGVHRGTLQIANGATVSAYTGAVIDFTVADRTTADGYLINNFDRLTGTPTYTITVSADLASGTYKLAQGASSFTGSISIGNGTTNYGSITVNGSDLVYDGNSYSLDQSNGNLTLTITGVDLIPPEKPIAIPSTTEITNKDVTVSVTYSSDSTVRQYKIGENGEWLDYTGAFAVENNDTIYFRAEDAAGNESTSSLVVTNIDKIAPTLELTADITTPTNGNVVLTATVSDGTVEYFNGTDWVAGTKYIVSTNGTYQFRVTDQAGNVTEKSFKVSNIDKVAPDQPTASASITKLTNQDVTITATYTADSAVKQYKIGDGAWQDYTGAITVSENATIYFRAQDVAGNISEITEYVVSNIDKVAPDQPTAAADITSLTNKDVTVTATYTADSAVKQYKIGDGAWQDYTGAFMVSENATIYFRAKDAAGNISEITEYVVSNIDKVAPDQPTASASITELTNQDVTITATYTADSAVKQYKIDDGAWQDYTGAFMVSENATIYFRAKDAAGNYSEITEYVVNNIIKGAMIDGSGMTHADAIAAGYELIVTTGGTYSSNIGHDGVQARIEGGTFSCTVGGGALTTSTNYRTWDVQENETNLTVIGGTFNKVLMGGDRVNYGNCEHTGDLNLTINGGTFNSQIVGGMAYTDQSLRGQALLIGDINMTLAGGTFKSRIYGGCISTANYSTRTAIEGNVNILVDSSENELIFADNVYIVAGSYQCGAIVGNVQVTFTGLGENLKMDADNLVWGGCSSDVYLINGDTRTFQSTISGSRTICFDDFNGKFNTGIRGFNIFTAENGSKLEILASNHLRDIEQWNLDWDTQLSGSFLNDFKGDTMAIDLTGWDQTATDLFDCAAGTFAGFDAMKKVTIGNETAVYSDAISGYVSTNYMLTLRDNQTMQLSMKTTIA